MAIPFLPTNLIQQTCNLLQSPVLLGNKNLQLENLKKYFKKRWLGQVNAEEISILDSDITTNNGTESYHAKLKGESSTAIREYGTLWQF